jgi:tetratricopeptide (TPR) repeat protein
MTNLRRFHDYTRRRGTSFHIAFCLMRQNWHEFLDLLRLAEELDCDVVVNTVIDPSYCSLFTLPTHELRVVVAELDRQNLQATAELRRNRAVWDAWIDKLRGATQAGQTATAETVMSSKMALHDDALTRAGRLAERREYEQALMEVRNVEASGPDRYYALTMSAYVRGLQGKWAEAWEDLRQAVRITDKLPDAFLNMARLGFRQGNLAEALESALRARDLVVPEDPRDAQVHAVLSLVYLRQWRLVRAYRAIAHWIALPRIARSPRIQDDAGLQIEHAPAGGGHREVLLQTLLVIAERSRAFSTRVGASFLHRRSPGLQVLRRQDPVSAVRLPVHSERGPGQRKQGGSPPLGTATLRVAGRSKARLVLPASGSEQIRVAIEQREPAAPHTIQLNYSGVAFVSNRSYSIRFRVRADAPRHIGWGIAMAREPWANLGLYRTLQVGPEWQEVHERFACRTAEECGRVHFDLAESAISIELASLVVVETDPLDLHGITDDC